MMGHRVATAAAAMLGPRSSNDWQQFSSSSADAAAATAATAAYYDSAAHYDVLWGQDNIHIGYYPHLNDRMATPLNFEQAGGALTRRMITVGKIDHTSRVLDFGCGKGIACAQIAELTGASCSGVDLSSGNIKRASAMAARRPELSLDFCVGSFTEISPSLHGQFTHVVAQESFVHAHAALPAIFEQVKLALVPEGLAVLNDYLGADGEVSDATRYRCVCVCKLPLALYMYVM